MSVVVYANGGPTIGLGHIVRCTALIAELRSRDIDVDLWTPKRAATSDFFEQRDVTPTACDHSEAIARIKDSRPAVAVLDSYEFTGDQFTAATAATDIVVIDELGTRQLPVEIVVNNNIYADEIEYPKANAVLRGPKYCMLRKEFRQLQQQEHQSLTDAPLDVLLTVGGADIGGHFEAVLQVVLEAIPANSVVHAVVGPYFEESQDLVDNVRFHTTPPNLPELMARSDIAISGGGQTLYELAALSIPAVAVTLGEDQVRNVDGLERAGTCLSAGKPSAEGFESTLFEAVRRLCDDTKLREKMAKRCRHTVDGRGTERVARRLASLSDRDG